ncbi:C-C motif chemokine 19 isoform X1 [Taeniopygia guttata]|uniref:C-C motif chemokine 19 isoform X1 n=1 Tax=Taeniopygia guttata TaxID=59729 RepID=UPI0013F20F49|nr:C-C motif chemokine 19 isoform X1 [Taeniopygia guttata]
MQRVHLLCFSLLLPGHILDGTILPQPCHPPGKLGEVQLASSSVPPPVHSRSNVLDCCLRTSEVPIPWWIVQDYWLQLVQDGCDIDAAVFITTKGKCLCAPLHSPWVIRLQKRLDATFAKRGK